MISIVQGSCVVWMNRTAVKIGLTLLLDIVKGISHIPSLEIGDIIETATIVHVDCSNALMLDLGDDIRGYTCTSKWSDKVHVWRVYSYIMIRLKAP